MKMPYPCVLAPLLVLGASVGEVIAAITPYPRLVIDEPSKSFTLKVEGTPVDCVHTAMQVGYAHFAFTGRVRIEITASEPIESYDLSPHRRQIAARVSGNKLIFWIDRPCKLHLRVNRLPRLFVFAESTEPTPVESDNSFRITDFGVIDSSTEIQTEQIQRAIDQVASRHGTLVVPRGVYLSGTLRLASNLHLFLEPGVVIRGTARLEDYPAGRGGRAQLRMENAENVRISGRGVIDNNGLAMRSQFLPDRRQGRVKMLVALRCRDVLVEDVVLRDSGVWCVHPVESERLCFRNLKVISVSRSETGPETSHNTDAFDPDNSSDVLIEDNFISVDDDAIAVKLAGGARRDMRNIVFRNNVVWTTCSALKIGTEVFGHTVRDVRFEWNDIVHADTGIVVQCYRGGYVDGARWVDNHFEQVGVVPNESPHRKGLDIYVNSGGKSSFGEIRNLLIERNVFERRNSRRWMIRGAGSRHIVEGVVFKGNTIAGKKADSAEAAQLYTDRDIRGVVFDTARADTNASTKGREVRPRNTAIRPE